MKRIVTGLASLILLLFVIQCGSKSKESEMNQYTDAELLQLAKTQYESGNAEATVKTCDRLLMNYPTSNLHIETQILQAKAYGALDQFENQMNLLLRLLRENIIPNYSPQILIQIGKFYERAALFNPGIVTSDTTDYRLAISYYEKAIKYPDSDDLKAKSEAQFRLALVNAKIGNIETAAREYKNVLKEYPDSDFSLLAQVKLNNPRDVSELAVDESSLNSYRKLFESSQPQQPKESALETPEFTEEEKEGSMDKLIEKTLETPQEQKPAVEEDSGETGEPSEAPPEEQDPFDTPSEP